MEKLLTGANRDLLDGRGRVLDMGSQDGELAFFLESLGYQVVAVDHPAYNHNGMRGIRALKAALGSAVEIHELDVDRPFTLPHDTYDLVFFLGILYHLRNPFYVLEELSRRTTRCFLSTRVARRFPDGSAMPPNVALAYLLAEEELNQDNSNYFIFSESGLRVMLERAHWDDSRLCEPGRHFAERSGATGSRRTRILPAGEPLRPPVESGTARPAGMKVKRRAGVGPRGNSVSGCVPARAGAC